MKRNKDKLLNFLAWACHALLLCSILYILIPTRKKEGKKSSKARNKEPSLSIKHIWPPLPSLHHYRLLVSCDSRHVIKKQRRKARPGNSFQAKKSAHVTATDIESKKMFQETGQTEWTDNKLEGDLGEQMHLIDAAPSSVKTFDDERWRNGNRYLNLFVKDGKIDWDGVITAEARRKTLGMYPEEATNTSPVLFRSSIIPWWAWVRRFYLPEAEQLNGRAAMIGFFMAYFVDGLTGMGLVDQTGNSLCKACLLTVVAGIILFRQTQDLGNMHRLIDEFTLYDKQWQATWKDGNANTPLQQDQARSRTK